jgi:molybdopterin synthase catalytic subunit
LEDVLLIRWTGCLAVGEIISLVAVSSPSSEDAFEACKFGISRMNEMSAITKIEKFADLTYQKEKETKHGQNFTGTNRH